MYKIECQINYLKNEKSLFIENKIIKNYKDKYLFDLFKRKIIDTCIRYKCNKIILTLNYEETIIMYITNIRYHKYMIEVYKKEEYLETLYYELKYYNYNDVDYYWFPMFIPMFFYPFILF